MYGMRAFLLPQGPRGFSQGAPLSEEMDLIGHSYGTHIVNDWHGMHERNYTASPRRTQLT